MKLSAPEVRWTAELLDGLSSDAERTGQDAYDGASAMRQALVAAAEAGGHPVAGAPTELAAFTGWLAETVADRVVTRDPSLVGSA